MYVRMPVADEIAWCFHRVFADSRARVCTCHNAMHMLPPQVQVEPGCMHMDVAAACMSHAHAGVREQFHDCAQKHEQNTNTQGYRCNARTHFAELMLTCIGHVSHRCVCLTMWCPCAVVSSPLCLCNCCLICTAPSPSCYSLPPLPPPPPPHTDALSLRTHARLRHGILAMTKTCDRNEGIDM